MGRGTNMRLDDIYPINTKDVLKHRSYAKFYLALNLIVKEAAIQFITPKKFAQLTGQNPTFSYHLFDYFNSIGIVKRVPNRKPLTYGFVDVENEEFLSIAKAVTGIK